MNEDKKSEIMNLIGYGLQIFFLSFVNVNIADQYL